MDGPGGDVVPVGLRNMGESCHLNAILTAMASSATFRSFSRRSALTCGGFAAVLNEVLDGTDGRGNLGVIDPWKLAGALAADGYRVDIPRDADETYDRILSILQAQLNGAAREVRLQSLDLRSAAGENGGAAGPRRQLMSPSTGLLERRLRCTCCGTAVDSKLEPFNRLSVSMPGKDGDDVELTRCLYEVAGHEEIVDDVRCDRCDRKTKHVLAYRVKRFPKVLCVHLKRLGWSAETGTPVRDSRSVRVELRLDKAVLSEPSEAGHNGAGAEYRLRAVVLHLDHCGRSGGHYTCLRYAPRSSDRGFATLRLNGIDREYGEWFYVNDDNVNSVNAPDRGALGGAYMLFYDLVTESMQARRRRHRYLGPDLGAPNPT